MSKSNTNSTSAKEVTGRGEEMNKVETGEGVKVSILGRDFFVACDEAQRESLDAAASFLDTQMRSIRDSGKVMGVERCAVMAALNISYELLDLREEAGDVSHVRDRIKTISEKIDSVMEDTRQVTMN